MGAHLGNAVHVATLRTGAQLLGIRSFGLFRPHDLRGFAEYLFLAVPSFTQGDLLLSHAGIVLMRLFGAQVDAGEEAGSASNQANRLR
jgi:hypothetical protein